MSQLHHLILDAVVKLEIYLKPLEPKFYFLVLNVQRFFSIYLCSLSAFLYVLDVVLLRLRLRHEA